MAIRLHCASPALAHCCAPSPKQRGAACQPHHQSLALVSPASFASGYFKASRRHTCGRSRLPPLSVATMASLWAGPGAGDLGGQLDLSPGPMMTPPPSPVYPLSPEPASSTSLLAFLRPTATPQTLSRTPRKSRGTSSATARNAAAAAASGAAGPTAEVPALVLQSVLISCLGAFAFGYHISVVNGPLAYILADIGATGSSLVGGWIVSISLAAAAAGALLGGVLADALGRRRALLVDAVPFIIGSALSATAQSVPQMLAGRAIVGAAFGIVSCVVPLYISEVSPACVRGSFGSFNQLAICVGIVAALLAGLPLSAANPSWWRAMFWLGALPAALLAAGLMLRAPESPSWLRKKGRDAEAIEAEALLTSATPAGSPGSEAASGAGPKDPEAQGAPKAPEVSMQELFSAKYRRVVSVGMLLFLLQQFAGINAVVYYSSSVFQRVGITSDVAASALVALANVLGTAAASQLVDSQGRKKLLTSSFAGMGASMLLLALTLALSAPQPLAGILSVLGTVAYVLAFALGVGPVPALLLPEIFPSRIRANGIALSLMSHWVCNFVIGLSFLAVVEAVGVAGAYAGFAVVCGIGILFVQWAVPETKGKSLEELESLFSANEGKKS